MIQERVTPILQQFGLKLDFVYLINLSPSNVIRFKVPQAQWSGKQLTYDKVRIFGCEAYALIPRDKRTKLVPHAIGRPMFVYSAIGR